MARSADHSEACLKRALALIAEATDLLDAHDGPPEAAAHLSLASECVRQVLSDRRK